MTKRHNTALVLIVVYTITALSTPAHYAAQVGTPDLRKHKGNWERGVSFFNQKQYREAIREFQSVLNANPQAWQSWYYICASHFQLQSYEDAIDASQNYIKAADKDEKAQAAGYFFVGMSSYQMKQYDKAIPALARYIALSNKTQQRVEPPARAALGRAYIFTDRFNEAIAVLTASAAEMGNNATNYYYIGFAQRKLGHDDQAIAALNQGLAIDPKDPDALTLLADIYLSQVKQNPAAVKQVISVGERLAAVRNDERVWGVLGQAYLIDKQYEKAAPLLDKFARAHADSSGAWYSLGVALSRSSQWKVASDALQTTIKLAPTNTAALLELGYVYESDGQHVKALGAYQQAYETSGRRDETARAGIDRITKTQPEQNAQIKPMDVESAKAPAKSTDHADSLTAEKRIALIVGNNSYKDAPLRNPVNDARAMARALRESGFEVLKYENIGKRQMEDQIRQFGKRLKGAIGLFYFSGHGAQVSGQNYMIPVGHSIEKEQDVPYEAVDAGRVLGEMEASGNQLNIVILDACRNNPFTRSFRSETRGLAVMNAPSGSIIAYSTGPGSVASDGEAENGLYTEELVRNILQPGLRIEDVFKRVRIAVRTRTNGKQVPWETSALEGDFYFVRR